MLAAEHLLDRLGVHLDAGHGGVERRRAQVEQADGAGADEDVAAGDLLGVERAVENAVGRRCSGAHRAA